MRLIFIFLFAAGITIAGDYVIIGNPFHGFKATPYLQSLDWKTNAVPAVAWLELKTNKSVKRITGMQHTVLNWGPNGEMMGCQCAQCQGFCFERTTTVDLIRIVEIEGQRYQQHVKQISSKSETFTVE